LSSGFFKKIFCILQLQRKVRLKQPDTGISTELPVEKKNKKGSP